MACLFVEQTICAAQMCHSVLSDIYFEIHLGNRLLFTRHFRETLCAFVTEPGLETRLVREFLLKKDGVTSCQQSIMYFELKTTTRLPIIKQQVMSCELHRGLTTLSYYKSCSLNNQPMGISRAK